MKDKKKKRRILITILILDIVSGVIGLTMETVLKT
jgi:hypothetical protein